jgi:1-acyl-sn-glycerol-3-phosphate acyltransferase
MESVNDASRRPEGRYPSDGRSPEISPLLLSALGRSVDGYLARHFSAVRLSKAQRPDPVATRDKPLILYYNHPSWWDPLVCLRLAQRLWPERRHYGPIDASALGGSRLFEKLGFFGVEPGSTRGARRFLETAQQILARRDAALWIAAEARLTDCRERPVKIRSGVGHLAVRVRQAVLVPLALEYPFWEERLPEALARFGEELPALDADLKATDWTAVLEDQLRDAQDSLLAESLTREAARFDVVLGGRAGAGGVSDVWRRLRARLRGEPFRPPEGEGDL